MTHLISHNWILSMLVAHPKWLQPCTVDHTLQKIHRSVTYAIKNYFGDDRDAAFSTADKKRLISALMWSIANRELIYPTTSECIPYLLILSNGQVSGHVNSFRNRNGEFEHMRNMLNIIM